LFAFAFTAGAALRACGALGLHFLELLFLFVGEDGLDLFVGLLAHRGHFLAHAFAIAFAEELPPFRALCGLDCNDLFLLVIGKVQCGIGITPASTSAGALSATGAVGTLRGLGADLG
jgi:hypothetical protein